MFETEVPIEQPFAKLLDGSDPSPTVVQFSVWNDTPVICMTIRDAWGNVAEARIDQDEWNRIVQAGNDVIKTAKES